MRNKIEWILENKVLIAGIILSSLLLTSLAADFAYSAGTYSISSSGRIAMGWLHTEGTQIVDDFGSVFSLQGANILGYDSNSHSQSDYAKMAGWGFNTVRLPIVWQYIEPQPGVFNSQYLDNFISRDLRWAEANGLHVVVDMHQWYWSPVFTFDATTGSGFPRWACSGYPNTQQGYQQAVTDFFLNKGPNGTTASPTNPSMQDRYMTMWKYVASKFANESVVAGYDLFNEPLNGRYMPPPQLTANLSFQSITDIYFSFHDKLASEIRKVDANHILFYELYGPYISPENLPVQAEALNDSNIVASFHFYHFRSSYNGDINWLNGMFNTWWWSSMKNLNIPIWVGEFGAFTEDTNSGVWARDTLNIFSLHGLGWTWWAYGKSDTDTFCLLHADGTERREWLQYLAS